MMQKSTSEYSLKSKWNQLVYRLSDTSSSNCHQHSRNDYRRPSHCSDQSVSSTASTATLDKLLLGIPGLFRRRCSNASAQSEGHQSIEEEHEEEFGLEESQRLDLLYQAALEEISYAEDSQGSRYYPGDVTTAKEAMDTCAQAFVQLLQQAPDRQSHDHLHSMIAPKLLTLQSRFDALPAIVTE